MGKKGRGARGTNQPQWQEDDFESLLPSSTRAGTPLRPATKEDVTKVNMVRLIWAPIEKKENNAQPNTSTSAAQTVAIAAPEKAVAIATTVAIAAPEKAAAIATHTAAQTVAVAAPEKAAAIATTVAIAAPEKDAAIAMHSGREDEQTVTDTAAEEATTITTTHEGAFATQTVVIAADEETVASVTSPDEEVKRLRLLLIAEQDATAAAITAAEEAAATATSLEFENRRLKLLLAEHAAAAAATAAADRVFVPGHIAPITTQEYQLQALHSQVVQLQQHLDAAVRDAQHWAYIAHMAETTYAAETAKATAGTVPSREEHTRSQPRAHNHAQPVTRCDPPLNGSDAKGTDQPTAAATSATTGPVPAVSPTRLRRKGANATGRNSSNNAAAAALQDVADAAAAAANCQDPNVLEAVLKAAAATAKALAECRVRAPQGHRRGGRPPPKERPRAPGRRRRTQRSAGPPAPRVTDTHTAMQSRRTQQGQHNPPTANSLLREGQNRPRPGAPFTSSNHAASSAMPAPRFAPPLSPAVTRRNGRNIADSAKPRMTQQGQHNPPTANSLLSLREGQNRPRPGAPCTSSNHAASSAMPVPRFAPPLSPAATRRNGRDIAESV